MSSMLVFVPLHLYPEGRIHNQKAVLPFFRNGVQGGWQGALVFLVSTSVVDSTTCGDCWPRSIVISVWVRTLKGNQSKHPSHGPVRKAFVSDDKGQRTALCIVSFASSVLSLSLFAPPSAPHSPPSSLPFSIHTALSSLNLYTAISPHNGRHCLKPAGLIPHPFRRAQLF